VYDRSPGSTIETIDHQADRCTLRGTRPGQPPHEETFTVADAKTAGLLKDGGNWSKYARAMTLARATSALCRFLWPDILMGCGYTPEELGSIDPAPAPAADPDAPRVGTRAERQQTPPAATVDPFKGLGSRWRALDDADSPDAPMDRPARSLRWLAYVKSVLREEAIDEDTVLQPEWAALIEADLDARKSSLPKPGEGE